MRQSRPPAASIMLAGVLDGGSRSQSWKEKAAASRSRRLHIVLLQLLLRTEAEKTGNTAMLNLLPDRLKWSETLLLLEEGAYSEEQLLSYVEVLRSSTDEERCTRYLELQGPKPLFILGYLLRPSAAIHDSVILSKLIDFCHQTYCQKPASKLESTSPVIEGMAEELSEDLTPNDFTALTTALAKHCFRVEPRLSLKMADLTSRYIETFANEEHPEQRYHAQCYVFNEGLRLFQPQSKTQLLHRSIPNEYMWEGQRKLLAMSARLPRPLLVDGTGFRAIRDVLAGLPKNQTEIHSAKRHAPTWPPYLLPGHGMDETADPEDNWSRTVGAGMLMQEAGFNKYEIDDALDILQGMSPDGTPTIQQRVAPNPFQRSGLWEASIQATRNANEAWERFQNPPVSGSEAGAEEYAAMFEKLVLREAPSAGNDLPGDKALNFPTKPRANLAEFEKARLRPPSVAQLYEQMHKSGIAPTGRCLQVLIANAESLQTAARYLYDSPEDPFVVRNLLDETPNPEILKKCPLGLFTAYIQALLRDGKKSGKHMRRAIRITELRLKGEKSSGASHIWGYILKHLGQRHEALKLTPTEQLNLLLAVYGKIESSHGTSLATFNQLNKCLRKVVRRQLEPLLNSISAEPPVEHPLASVYDHSHEPTGGTIGQTVTSEKAKEEQGPDTTKSVAALILQAKDRIKSEFETLTAKESAHQQHVYAQGLTAQERLLARNDPIRSEHALEYLLALAYVGNYNEMARMMAWLVDEWSQPDLIQAVKAMDEIPGYAEFFDVLCTFRLFAEPMLDGDAATSLRAAIASKGLHWAWPDDEAVDAYAELQGDETVGLLRSVLEWTRYRQHQRQGEI